MEFLISSGLRRQQHGISLIYALLALATLALASVALIRSANTSSMVVGNLGFQQEATAAADLAVKVAIASLKTNLATLASTTPGGTAAGISGYYPSTDEHLDATGFMLYKGDGSGKNDNARTLIKWDGDYCSQQVAGTYASCAFTPVTLADEVNGNRLSYVIFRLCNKAGDPASDTTVSCAYPLQASTASSGNMGGLGYRKPPTTLLALSPYYRIIVRVVGARKTTSYTETIVHF
jgi:type IV pilus assembly protein PilX